ncbi:MAG: argininosuccinate synthase [Gammaproteobacteria bacterium 39-13]|nr:argininosuccinate synthase [Gammaproteobacteria bacterium]OJV89095.1 MAG: argininosuccinate synthase [Gammaproteobacteria bacterium 39-13]
MNKKPKVVLAYSGGLDTSIMIHWLKAHYDCEVIACVCDVGQGAELNSLEEKALKSGASKFYCIDVKDEFVKEYLWRLLKANAKYENQYLLGTISRPLIAKALVEVAAKEDAEYVSHGATGKGNDQVRFELAFKALAPYLKIIAPWREWEIKSRTDAMLYAQKYGIPVPVTIDKPYSRDKNLWYISHEGGVLEDPANPAPHDLCLEVNPIDLTPQNPEIITITFDQGNPIAVSDLHLDPVSLMNRLNEKASLHGIGIIDMVENRLVGMKSRGVYETPGGTLLYKAHQILESICLDRATLHFKHKLSQDYANLVYEGRWFTPLREALDAFIQTTQNRVSGKVTLKLHKGHCFSYGVESPFSLYDPQLATFEKDSAYNQADAHGFITLYGLPLKIQGIMTKRIVTNEK